MSHREGRLGGNSLRKSLDTREDRDTGQGRDGRRRPETAEAILAAAALLMPDYGYGRVTVRDVARRAGVGLGTVYGHFPGKEEIAAELVARGVEGVHAEMQALLDADLPPGERLRRLLVARVASRLEQTRGQRHPINEGTPELAAALAPRLAAWREAERSLVSWAVGFGQDTGEVVAGDPQDLAWTLLWATDGLVFEALQPPAEAPYREAPPSGVSPPSVPISLSISPAIPSISPPSVPAPETLAHKVGRVADLLVAGVTVRRP